MGSIALTPPPIFKKSILNWGILRSILRLDCDKLGLTVFLLIDDAQIKKLK